MEVVHALGWVREVCAVGTCPTSRQRRADGIEWTLLCTLCFCPLDGRPAGPCEACIARASGQGGPP